LLLDWRADVSATNNYQDTALHLAARDGHLSITRLLVAKGASVHAQNRFQMTPLELAMRHKRAGWEAVTAFLREEALDIHELPPAARAMRKIRKAFHSQPPPNGLRKLEPCLAPPQPPPPALRDVAAEPVIPSSGADLNKGRRAPLRYRPAAASAEAEAEPQQYT
jgi:ankyrin repeat protein